MGKYHDIICHLGILIALKSEFCIIFHLTVYLIESDYWLQLWCCRYRLWECCAGGMNWTWTNSQCCLVGEETPGTPLGPAGQGSVPPDQSAAFCAGTSPLLSACSHSSGLGWNKSPSRSMGHAMGSLSCSTCIAWMCLNDLLLCCFQLVVVSVGANPQVSSLVVIFHSLRIQRTCVTAPSNPSSESRGQWL